jgi:uncharacterized protein involved in exopolysaccharide biosynthesis
MDWVQIDGREIPLLEAPQKYENPPRRILYVLFKHKKLVRNIFLLLIVPMSLYLLLRPTEYVAVSKVLIKPSRAFIVSPSQRETDDGLSMLPTPEMLNTEVQIIKSPQVAERVVKDVPFPFRVTGKVPPVLSEKTIVQDGRLMRALLAATPGKNANVIEISLASEYPQEWTARAVNRAAEVYLEEHVKVHKIQGVEQFYDEQEKNLLNQLTQAENALKDFQQKENIVDAPQEVNADLNALTSFQKTLNETNSAIKETEQKVAVLDDQLKHQKPTVSSNTNITANPVYLQIQNKITQLQLERDGLLQRYTPEDRMVKDKEKEIEELKKQLESVKQTSVGSESVSINEVHRRILNELLGARVQLKALNEKKAVLTQQVADYSSAAADKQRKGYEYDRLLRDVTSKRDSLKLYKQKAEEARISDAMDERKFSNGYILERANLPLKKAGRGFNLLFILALIGSAGAAIAAAFGLEFFNRTVRNETDIEERLGLPVLATIQYYGDLRPVPTK